MGITPGWKTTEFWRTLIADVAGFGLIVYGVIKANETAIAIGGGIVGLSTAGYSVSRGLAKKPVAGAGG